MPLESSEAPDPSRFAPSMYSFTPSAAVLIPLISVRAPVPAAPTPTTYWFTPSAALSTPSRSVVAPVAASPAPSLRVTLPSANAVMPFESLSEPLSRSDAPVEIFFEPEARRASNTNRAAAVSAKSNQGRISASLLGPDVDGTSGSSSRSGSVAGEALEVMLPLVSRSAPLQMEINQLEENNGSGKRITMKPSNVPHLTTNLLLCWVFSPFRTMDSHFMHSKLYEYTFTSKTVRVGEAPLDGSRPGA